ncbi:MAG: metallophosphoesterase [Pseudomonadota bacterium]
MAIFFTSDTHFGHGGARGLFRRPFATTALMDETMVAHWNAAVGPEDEIWHLGDFAVGRDVDWIETCLAELNSEKHLIAGNNDKKRTRKARGWASVSDYEECLFGDRLFVLCHYPFRSWRKMDKGSINLHGHCHGRMKPLTRQIDVGVDAWEFRPVSLDGILHNAQKRRRTAPSGG